MKLSVLIPVYNEEETIEEVIIRVRKTEMNKEIIIVDDASNDSTRRILNDISQRYYGDIKIIYREKMAVKAQL